MVARSTDAKLCKMKDCGRALRAKGYCQTHYKHLLKFGRPRPIRPKQPPRPDAVRMSGLSLTTATVQVLKREAKRRNVTKNAVITDILEDWLAKGGGKRGAHPSRGR